MIANEPIPVGREPPPMNPRIVTSPLAPGHGKADKPGKAKGNPRARLRFQEVNAFLDVTMAGLTMAQRSVWLLLWRDTKPNGLAETSQVDLARRAGISDRAVRKALTRLRALGLVNVVKRGSLRRGRSISRVHPLGQGQ